MWTMDGPFAGMQNTDIGLASTINCPVCPVTDRIDVAEPITWPSPTDLAQPGRTQGRSYI